MKTALLVCLLLFGAATLNATAHNVWLESRDQADWGITRGYMPYMAISMI